MLLHNPGLTDRLIDYLQKNEQYIQTKGDLYSYIEEWFKNKRVFEYTSQEAACNNCFNIGVPFFLPDDWEIVIHMPKRERTLE